MLYEGLKENSTIVIVPSTAAESIQFGGPAGMTALTMRVGQGRAIKDKESDSASNNGAKKTDCCLAEMSGGLYRNEEQQTADCCG